MKQSVRFSFWYNSLIHETQKTISRTLDQVSVSSRSMHYLTYLRFILLLVLITRFGGRWYNLDQVGTLSAVRLLFLLYFAYDIYLLAQYYREPARLAGTRLRYLQVFFDLLFASFIRYFAQDIASSLFLLYLLPLFLTTISSVSLRPTLLVFLVTSLCVIGLDLQVIWSASHLGISAFVNFSLVHLLFLGLMTTVFMSMRRIRPLTDLKHRSHNLILALDDLWAHPDEASYRDLRSRLGSFLDEEERSIRLLSQEWEERLEKQDRLLASIFDLSSLISAEAPQTGYRQVLETASQLLDCQAATIHLLCEGNEGNNEMLTLEASVGFAHNYGTEAHLLISGGDDNPVVQCFRRHEPIEVIGFGSSPLTATQSTPSLLHPPGHVSKLCLPIHSQGITFGVLTLHYKRGGPFSPNVVRMGKVIASFLAIAIRKDDEVKQRQRELAALLELSIQLSTQTDTQLLLGLAVEVVHKWLNTETTSIFLLDESGILCRAAIAGMPCEWFPEEQYRPGVGLTGKALQGQVICENNVVASREVVPAHLARYRHDLRSRSVQHLLAVPLVGQQRRIGVLRSVNKLAGVGSLSTQGFTEWDRNLLFSLACQIALAIEGNRNATLIRRQVEMLTRLEAGAVAVTSSATLEDVLHTLVDLSSKLVGAAFGGIAIVEKGGRLVTSYENYPGIPPLHERARPEGMTTRVILTRKPVLIDDVQARDGHNSILIDLGIRSYAGLPIIEQGELLGVMFVHSFEPNAFGDAMPVLGTFANYAAIAIRDSRQFQDLRRLSDRLATLHDISLGITAQLNFEDLLHETAEKAANLLEADAGGIVLYDSARRTMRLVSDGSEPKREGQEQILGEGLISQAIQQGKPQIGDNCEVLPKLGTNLECSTAFVIVLAVPIVWQHNVLGVLYVGNIENGRLFDQVDIQSLQLLANYSAILLNRILYYDQIRKEKNALQEYVGVIQKVRQHMAPGLASLLAFVVNSGAQLLQAEDCSIYLVTEENQIVLKASNHIPAQLWGKNATPVSQEDGAGLTAFVAATGKALHFTGDAYKQHPAWSGQFLDHLESFEAKASRSLLIVPMYGTDGKVVGVLKVENKRSLDVTSSFTDIDESLLINLAQQAAASIEIIERDRHLRDSLAKKERLRLRDELHDATNAFRTGIKWRVETAIAWLRKQDYENARKELESASVPLNELSDLFQYIMDDLDNPLLREEGLVVALGHFARTRSGQVKLEGTVTGHLAPSQELAIYRICQEALRNTWKHAQIDASSPIIPKVVFCVEKNQLTVIVSDNGCGFDSRKRAPEHSVGLRVMEQWADDEGIPFQLKTQLDQGTRITIGPVPLR